MPRAGAGNSRHFLTLTDREMNDNIRKTIQRPCFPGTEQSGYGCVYQVKGGLLVFNIGGTELLLILFIAFVVVGPEDMPKIGRALGKGVRMLRSLINEVRKESGFDEVDEAVKDIRRDLRDISREADIRRDIDKVRKEADLSKEVSSLQKDLKEIGRDVSRGLNKEMGEKK